MAKKVQLNEKYLRTKRVAGNVVIGTGLAAAYRAAVEGDDISVYGAELQEATEFFGADPELVAGVLEEIDVFGAGGPGTKKKGARRPYKARKRGGSGRPAGEYTGRAETVTVATILTGMNIETEYRGTITDRLVSEFGGEIIFDGDRKGSYVTPASNQEKVRARAKEIRQELKGKS
ncbi:MAG: hypothetical protein DRO99_00020 [Candidatus Aenigmatarchaeota archaeon]|nr:MAG: hypothetical protein DRO99_00020 [Candidatus Aenigmarchaeota archaeon]